MYAAVEDEISTSPLIGGCFEAASQRFNIALTEFGIETLGSGLIDKSAAYEISGPDVMGRNLTGRNHTHNVDNPCN